MKHSNLGASGAERWFNCSGSVELQKGIPSVSSEAAKEGTLAHELAEQMLRHQVPDASTDKNMHEAVWVYTDYVKRAGWDKCIERYRKIRPVPPLSIERPVLYVEQQFDLSFIHEGMFGTNDACILDSTTGHLEIIDYKHGEGKYVEVENNLQLLYYALGAYHNFKKQISNISFYSITLTIVQPRFKGADPIRSWEIDEKTLLEFEDTLR